jgi:hypothetical protein
MGNACGVGWFIPLAPAGLPVAAVAQAAGLAPTIRSGWGSHFCGHSSNPSAAGLSAVSATSVNISG